VALAGRSNVGKSSLLNRLASAKRLAAVSRTPGRTRTLNFFRVEGRAYLVDLPGYGFAKASREARAGWEKLVRGYLLARPPLRLTVLLVDARHEPMASDLEMRDLLQRSGMPLVTVATKVDKLPRSRRRQQLELIGRRLGVGEEVLGFSAITGEGRKELWNVIAKHVSAPM
jgi:GTP-binding protein